MSNQNSYHPDVSSQISHELRIPVTGILGMVHFLNQTSLTEEQKDWINTIQSLAERLLSFESKLPEFLNVKGDTAMNTSSNKALKILLVEDEAIARLVNCRFLEELGYHPDVAENGQAAIDMAANGYDVIFMDIGLPDINGIDATKEIRKREADGQQAHIFALTAYQISEVYQSCMDAGMNNIFNKPITVKELAAVLDAV